VKIYTGMTSGEKLDKIKERDMGIMISSSPHASVTKSMKDVYCALDNGAFSCFSNGFPFQEDIFLNTIKACYKNSIKLDFIVCPDIVQGGLTSLDFSMSWATGRLLSTPNLALVVQDGMTPKDISVGFHLKYFSYIFIGGSVRWKWGTAEDWVAFAKDNGKKIHIGQCGQIKHLVRARELKVDSVDSTSWTINNSFDIIDDFREDRQPRLVI